MYVHVPEFCKQTNKSISVMIMMTSSPYFTAIMLGVRDSQITPANRHSLVSFAQWIHLEAKDHDLEFVQTVLYFSTQILQRSSASAANNNGSNKRFNNNRLARSASNLANSCNRPPESNSFHVHPRRLTEVLKSSKKAIWHYYDVLLTF